MRTTINIDEELLDKVVKATGERTKAKAIDTALREYTRHKHIQEWTDSWGKIIVDDYSDQGLELEVKQRAHHTGHRP